MEHTKLVGLHEVALMANVTRSAVSNWVARKPNFPTPLADLASGPVWNAADIERWLSSQRIGLSLNNERKNMEQFIVGQEYSMAQIHQAIGGDTMSYLPQSGGRIVGGRFKKETMNPNAPYQILVGNLPRVIKKAEILAKQRGIIPVFLKEGPNRWCYHGPMQLVSYVNDLSAITNTSGVTSGVESRLEGVAGILTFEDVK